jgi:hypothetical protein
MSPLPSTLYAELLALTSEQEAKVAELKERGWQQVTPPEDTFGGSLLMEDIEGVSHYVDPDGTLR